MADNDTSALGISLEIPDEVFEKMEKADKYLDGLADKTEATANSIVEDFKRMGDDGVNYFIQRLSEAHSLLSSLGSTQFSVSGIDFSAGKKELEELTAAQEELTAAQERYNELKAKDKELDNEFKRLNEETKRLYDVREIARAEEEINQTLAFRLKEQGSYDKALDSLVKDYMKVANAIKKYDEAEAKTGGYPKGGSYEQLDYLRQQELHYRNAIHVLRQYKDSQDAVLGVTKAQTEANQKATEADEKRKEALQKAHGLQFRDSKELHTADKAVAAAKKKVAEAEAALGRAIAENKGARTQEVESLKQVGTQSHFTAEEIKELATAFKELLSQQQAGTTTGGAMESLSSEVKEASVAGEELAATMVETSQKTVEEIQNIGVLREKIKEISAVLNDPESQLDFEKQQEYVDERARLQEELKIQEQDTAKLLQELDDAALKRAKQKADAEAAEAKRAAKEYEDWWSRSIKAVETKEKELAKTIQELDDAAAKRAKQKADADAAEAKRAAKEKTDAAKEYVAAYKALLKEREAAEKKLQADTEREIKELEDWRLNKTKQTAEADKRAKEEADASYIASYKEILQEKDKLDAETKKEEQELEDWRLNSIKRRGEAEKAEAKRVASEKDAENRETASEINRQLTEIEKAQAEERKLRKQAEEQAKKDAAQAEKDRYEAKLLEMYNAQKELEEAERAALEKRREIAANAEKIEEENYQATLARGAREQKAREDAETAEFNRQKAAIEEQNRLQIEAAKEREQAEKDAAAAAKERQDEAIANMKEALAEQDRLNKEAERQAKLQAKYDSESRKQRYQSYITSYDGALRTAEKADTISKRTQAIKNLQVALNNLSKTDADYEYKVKTLKDTMALLNHQNNVALGKTKEYREEVKKLSNESGILSNTMGQLKRAIALAFSVSQIKGYVKTLIDVRGEFDKQNRALAAIMQNKDEADRLWGQIAELAVKSPFQLKELTTYTKQLAAYRVENEKLFEVTKMLADVSAGLGVGMDRLILAYGQVKAANYLRGTELRQFSEAGINILGELAAYFSELEGRAVSVGEVFERVSKRMVTFKDVEVIFEKLTSKGGEFYQMQEVQAKSIAGMRSNLSDSLDLMMNEIGQSNDAAIKGMLKLFKTLIDNYKLIIDVVAGAGVAFGVHALKVVALNLVYKKLMRSTNPVEARLGRIRLAALKGAKGIEKFTFALSSIGKAIKANVWLIAVAAIVAATKAIVDHARETKKAQEEYDVLSRKISATTSTLNELVTKVREQEQVISDAKDKISELEEGTDAYEKASQDLNDAERKQISLLQQLKTEYPELYNQYVSQGESVDALVVSQQEYNKELRQTLALNHMMQSGETFWSDGISKDYKDLAAANSKVTAMAGDIEGAYVAAEAKIRALIATNERFANRYGEQFEEIFASQEDDYTKLIKLRERLLLIPDFYGGHLKIANASNDVVGLYEKALKKVGKASEEASKETENLIKQALLLNGVLSETDFASADQKTKESIKKNLRAFIDSMPNINDEFIQKFVNEKVKASLGFEFDFSNDEKKELSDIAKDINKYIDDQKFSASLKITADDTSADYFEKLREQYEGNQKTIEKLTNAEKERYEVVEENGKKVVKDNETAKKALEEEQKQIKAVLEAYGEFEKTKTDKKEETEAQKAERKRLKDQLDLLKDINDMYNKNRDAMGEFEAVSDVQTGLKDRATDLKLESFLEAGKFTDKDLEAYLKNLLETVAPRLRGEVHALLSDISGTINLETRVTNREDFERAREEVFEIYETLRELKEEGFDDNFIKNFFDIDTKSLADIEADTKNLKPAYDSYGNAGAKLYKEHLERIARIRREDTEREAKEMAKYLKAYIDEVEKAQIEGAKSITFFQKMFEKGAISAEQFGDIMANILKDTRDSVAKVNLEKFKEGALYIKSMGNLAAYTKDELTKMANELKDTLAKNAKNMGVDEIKEYQEALERVTEQMDQIKLPSQQNNIAELLRLVELQEQLVAAKKEEADLETQKKNLESQKSLLEKTLQSQKDGGDLIGAASTAKQLEGVIAKIQGVNGQLANTGMKISGIASEIGQITGGATNVIAIIDLVVQEVNNVCNAVKKTFGDIMSLADSFGVDTEKGGWRKASMFFEGMSNFNEQVTQGWENLKSGNFAGAIANAIGSITGLIRDVNKWIDSGYAEEIERQTKRVEDLTKEYEKLGKEVDEAMSVANYQRAFKQLQDNIESRIDAEKAIIAAEEAKKNSDEDALREAEERLDALLEESANKMAEKLAGLNGFGSKTAMQSSAQQFADAWLSAYKETGDGLDALNEQWDEYIENVIAKQLMLKGSEKFLEPIMSMLDSALADSNYSTQEAASVQKAIDELMPKLNEYWKAITAGFDIKQNAGSETEMSGLQKGIQAVTEDTAQALEALLNSVRFYAADTNAKVAALTSFDPELNPLLAELKLQTSHILSIERLVKSIVRTGHRLGESGIRVFLD